jgi:hypothetical protein
VRHKGLHPFAGKFPGDVFSGLSAHVWLSLLSLNPAQVNHAFIPKSISQDFFASGAKPQNERFATKTADILTVSEQRRPVQYPTLRPIRCASRRASRTCQTETSWKSSESILRVASVGIFRIRLAIEASSASTATSCSHRATRHGTAAVVRKDDSGSIGRQRGRTCKNAAVSWWNAGLLMCVKPAERERHGFAVSRRSGNAI